MKVALALEMEWGLKHHSEIYAGCQRFANEAKVGDLHYSQFSKGSRNRYI